MKMESIAGAVQAQASAPLEQEVMKFTREE